MRVSTRIHDSGWRVGNVGNSRSVGPFLFQYIEGNLAIYILSTRWMIPKLVADYTIERPDVAGKEYIPCDTLEEADRISNVILRSIYPSARVRAFVNPFEKHEEIEARS